MSETTVGCYASTCAAFASAGAYTKTQLYRAYDWCAKPILDKDYTVIIKRLLVLAALALVITATVALFGKIPGLSNMNANWGLLGAGGGAGILALILEKREAIKGLCAKDGSLGEQAVTIEKSEVPAEGGREVRDGARPSAKLDKLSGCLFGRNNCALVVFASVATVLIVVAALGLTSTMTSATLVAKDYHIMLGVGSGSFVLAALSTKNEDDELRFTVLAAGVYNGGYAVAGAVSSAFTRLAACCSGEKAPRSPSTSGARDDVGGGGDSTGGQAGML